MFVQPKKFSLLFKALKLNKTIILFACALFLLINNNNAQTLKHQLDEIIVTAGRTPISFSDLTRDVLVINSAEIKNIPANSVQDVLEYAVGVDLRPRGIDGVQADVSIRGGTFEQTLILIDGVKINDPQTGHHNLNLPVSLDDVERIEILKGQGSKIFGANAFSGVINIITKKGYKKSLSLKTAGGQYGFYNGAISVSYPLGSLSNHISFSKKKSDGYRHNTNFDIINFSYNSTLSTNFGKLNFLFGYDDKKFGSNGFYSSIFPNQWEHTTTKFFSAGADLGNKNLLISPKIFWRRNDDNYLLDYEKPSFYQNIHQTNVYGAEVQASLKSGFGVTSFGGELTEDKIKSTNLGNHKRNNGGIFLEHRFSPIENFTINAGAFAYNYSSIGWKYWPGIDFGYSFSKSTRMFASAGKAFRVPTYTELYYSSPSSEGNPNLKYEETTNYEAGIKQFGNYYSASFSLFRKEGKNLIDWIRTKNGDPWIAANIGKVNTNGAEFTFNFLPGLMLNNFPITKVSLDYTYLNSDKKTENFDSEYLLDYLRQQLIFTVINNWWLDINQSWIVRYENRIFFEDHIILDTQLFKDINNLQLFLKATNLFNKSYQQISGVPLPGRWIYAGVNLKFE